MIHMRWGLRSQLVSPVVLLLLGVAAISATTAVASARQARAQVEERLRTVARFLTEESRFPLKGQVLQWLRQLSGAEYVLHSADGRYHTSLEGAPDGALFVGVGVADDWQELRLGAPVRVGGTTYLCSGIRLRRGLYILYPESLWRDARWEAIWPSLVLGASVGLAALALAVAQARRVSGRVRDLERRARLIAGGDFSPMPLPGRDDEVRDLGRSINEMAQQLAQFQKTAAATERLRLLGQVSGGLAHQLRNGLTGARLAVQLYLREAPAGADASALLVALRQLALLETHVKRFLDLGREEAARREPCDLTALVGEAVELLTPRCRHAGIELEWRPPEGPCSLSGDAGQLTQLIVNVLTNAIEAAGPGGTVRVELAGRGAGAVLEVCDSGPGPPAEVAERLFEPFVTGKPEGVGLGLAVARQVALRHQGKIDWARRDGWTCFRVELPGG
jgi:signal transduction histidine kinase